MANVLVVGANQGICYCKPLQEGKRLWKSYASSRPKFAFEIYRAKKVSLGVFENNLPAYYCYKAVGFSDVALDATEKYCILGEEWKCKELMMEK